MHRGNQKISSVIKTGTVEDRTDWQTMRRNFRRLPDLRWAAPCRIRESSSEPGAWNAASGRLSIGGRGATVSPSPATIVAGGRSALRLSESVPRMCPGQDCLHRHKRMVVMSRRLKGGDLRIPPCAFSVALSYGEFDLRATDAIIRMSVAEALQMLRGSASPAKHERHRAAR